MDELKIRLEQHKMWLLDNDTGKKFVVATGEDLSSANLSSANLRYANLSSANLSSADLRYANLSSANLRYANLSLIKKDFFERLLIAKNEAKGLFDYLMKGKVSGSSYTGECACFVGTIANITKENYANLSSGLKPDDSSHTERWFFGILKGDTPENNQVSKITCEWVQEFCKEHAIVLPEYKIVSSDECPGAFK